MHRSIRVITKYYKNKFNSASYKVSDQGKFSFINYDDTIILMDHERVILNKLHIGKLIINNNPHLESVKTGGIRGPRLDLNELDLNYANQRLEFLESIQNPEIKREKVLKFTNYGMFSITHRLRELAASPEKLRQMIDEEKKKIDFSMNLENNTFVYDQVHALESLGYELIRDIDNKIRNSQFFIETETRIPKIIVSPYILDSIEHMYDLTVKTIDFITKHPNFDLNKAKGYWKKVRTYAESIGEYDFIKYSQKFIHHLAKHFPENETIGSEFTYFENPVHAIDTAFDILVEDGYEGERKIIEYEFPYKIGLEGIISLEELPRDTEVMKKIEDEEYEVNVVTGIPKKPTNNMVIVAGPLDETHHGFYSICPGKYYPQIYEDPDFWEIHAFIE